MLSMHSIRETTATDDVLYLIELFKSFYDNYEKVDSALNIDRP